MIVVMVTIMIKETFYKWLLF